MDLRGAYVNLDGGFDSRANRKCIFNAGMIPNIKENPRNRKTLKRGRKRLFNAAIHALRMRVERTFAWEDKFKRLLLRFERIQQRHYGMKLLAYTLINLRCSAGSKTRNQLIGNCCLSAGTHWQAAGMFLFRVSERMGTYCNLAESKENRTVRFSHTLVQSS